MPLAVIGRSRSAPQAWRVAAALLTLVPLASPAIAESAYVAQLGAGGGVQFSIPFQAPPEFSHNGSPVPGVVPPPTASLAGKNPRNVALSATFGNFDQTVQVQLGMNDQSALGVWGNNDTAGVFQLGNNLRSNIGVLGQGLTVGVIEPNGAPPVNMLIARLPSGRLLIVH